MKTKILFALSAILATVGAFAADSRWTYDSTAGTISDGDWTFAATVNGTDLTVGAHSANPAVVSDLDFGKPVVDAGNVAYTIVALNPAFNNDAAGKLIGRLTLPASGLLTIGNDAFNQCTALTNVVNYIPDSVTRVGQRSFYKCPAKQELRVLGVTHFSTLGSWGGGNREFYSQQAFAESGVTRIVFGPGLKEIADWDKGPFSYCRSLTNVTFDAAMTGGRFSGGRCGGFYGCTALAGTIDLSGFSDLSYVGTVGGSGRALGNTALKKVILGSGLQKLDVNFFDQMGKLEEVVFNSAPGDFAFTTNIAGGVMFGELPATQGVVARIRAQDKAAWLPFSATGEINPDDTTFSADFAGANYTARFLLSDEESHYSGDLGEWIYDHDAAIVSNELWTFSASGVAGVLTVGACVKYPSVASLLDFSASVTDASGKPFAIRTLDTQMGIVGNYNTSSTAAGLAVADLRLPDGLATIGRAAFARLNNCTNVVNFLPDSTSVVGEYAFHYLPVSTPLSLKGVVYLGSGTKGSNATFTFGNSGITDVTFGPDFKELRSWARSAFASCMSLTNVTFDPAMSGALMEGIRTDGFYGCTALAGTVDLSGFAKLKYSTDSYHGEIFKNTKVDTLVFGEGITHLESQFMSGMAHLTTVIFKGPPPLTEFDTPYLAGVSGTQLVATYVHKAYLSVTNAAGMCWLDYSADGKVNGKKPTSSQATTFAAQYLVEGVDPAMRPLVTLEPDMGLSIFVR